MFQPGSGDLLLGRGGFEGSVGNGFSNDNGGNGSNGGGTPAPGQSASSTFDLSDFPSLGGGAPGAVSGGGDGSLANALRQQQQLMQQQMMQGAPSSGSVSSGGGGGQGQVQGQGQGQGGQGQGGQGQGQGQGHGQVQVQVNGKQQAQSSNLYRLAMGSSMANSLVTAGTNGANFKMATEDFPALPGAPLGGAAPGSTGSGLLGGIEGGQTVSSSANGISFGSTAPSVSRASPSGGVFGGESLDGLTNQFDSASLLSSGGVGGNISGNQSSNNPGLSQQQRTSSSTGGADGSGGGNPGPSGGSALSGDFGLLGLLKVIRMTDADRNALALGSDLTSLGLNLNSSDSLYSTFASPWSENATNREPQYQLPMCYYMQPPALKTGHLSKFQLETLFYIFYALPKDVLQAYAAQELYAREWKFHVELKLWFKRASPADGVTSSAGGMQFIYFDINQWERRLFNGNMNQNITSGLLPEDDIRVKFSSS